MSNEVGYKWEPIKDLPADISNLTIGELPALIAAWNDIKSRIVKVDALNEFQERVKREWAIETGLIERVYTFDRGITETLIERGIDAAYIPHSDASISPELTAQIIVDHKDTLDGLFAFVKGNRPLTTSYLNSLHSALLKHQDSYDAWDSNDNMMKLPLKKGVYKQFPNNPNRRGDGKIHEYCPPAQVAPQIEQLLKWHEDHEARNVPIEIESAWLHHRFTQIHPFPDGNGRVVRALASIMFIKAGGFELLVTDKLRADYIDALERADNEHLFPLVNLFNRIQCDTLVRAIDLVKETMQIKEAEAALLASIREKLKNGEKKPEWSAAQQQARQLILLAQGRMQVWSENLSKSIKPVSEEFNFELSSHLNGLHPPSVFHERIELKLITQQTATIMLVFQKIGLDATVPISGIMHYSNTFDLKTVNVTHSPFQINISEDYALLEKRFSKWLDESLLKALALWEKTL